STSDPRCDLPTRAPGRPSAGHRCRREPRSAPKVGVRTRSGRRGRRGTGRLGSGRVPDQIPALASADPRMFGLAVATAEGEVHGVGEWRRRFSIQSISKVFTLALVIEKDGEALWTRGGP